LKLSVEQVDVFSLVGSRFQALGTIHNRLICESCIRHLAILFVRIYTCTYWQALCTKLSPCEYR